MHFRLEQNLQKRFALQENASVVFSARCDIMTGP